MWPDRAILERVASGLVVMMRRVVALALVGLLVLPLIPSSSAEWEEDAWLTTIIGPERLEMGDEYGCHGMVDGEFEDYSEEISACRDYLTERVPASNWGSNPISLGLDADRLAEIDADAILAAGFAIVDAEVQPADSGLEIVAYNGGSLEKNRVTIIDFQELLDNEVPLINFNWQGRDHDVVVRQNTELVADIDATTAWFTTWGEHASYQQRKTNFSVNDSTADSWIVSFDNDEAANSDVFWDVAISNQFSNLGSDVVSVSSSDGLLTELTAESPHLQAGWRQLNDSLILTLNPGQEVEVEFESDANVNASQQTCDRFNCHVVAITVAGLHTNDLFDWSRRWDETPMRFTWLIVPKEVAEYNWVLPAFAVFLALTAPVAILWLVKNDRRAQQVVEVFNSLDNLEGEQEGAKADKEANAESEADAEEE